MVTNSPKRRRCHSSRPRSEPTAPRQAAQKKIVETKTHLSTPYDSLDLEKIMDSQDTLVYPEQLSGITDDTKPHEVEYVTPVLGTLTVHGVTDTKPDLDVMDLEEMAMSENATAIVGSENTPNLLSSQPSFTSSPKRLDTPVDELITGITDNNEDNMAQVNTMIGTTDTPLMTPVTDSLDTPDELNGVTTNPESGASGFQPNTNSTSPENPQMTSNIAHNKTFSVMADSTENNPTYGSNQENNSELSDNNDVPETNQETGLDALNGVTTPLRSPETQELDTLPDLVLNSKTDVINGNITEDTNEVADALLQLSQSDILPEENPELPIGVLPVDAAPVPITLGNDDVLNTIENFKQNNKETGRVPSVNDNTNRENTNNNSNEKENKKSHETEDEEPKQTADEPTTPTSPAKGSLVIVKHGIKRKKNKGRTYKCTQCDKRKKSTQELNKHYRLKHKALMCGICNKLFDLPGTLKKPMYGHLDRPFKCDSCNKKLPLRVRNSVTTGLCIRQSALISAWHRIVVAASCGNQTWQFMCRHTIKTLGNVQNVTG